MKNLKKMIFAVLCAFFVTAATPGTVAGQSADAPETVIYDAESAMEVLKTLSGDWFSETSASGHGAYTPVASFKVAAAGTAIIETTGADTPNEMATIFHMDGDQLLQTHYCALMNAPVLRFVQTEKPGELKFVFHGGTNFDVTVDAHFHEGTVQIRDEDTIETSFVVFANGEKSTNGRSVLKRMKKHSN